MSETVDNEEAKKLAPPSVERTTSLDNRLIQHTIDMENGRAENEWRSLCVVMDRRAVQYFSQLIICVVIIAFCIIQLVRIDDCNDQQMYSGLLTFVIGLILPQPRFRANSPVD